MQEKILSKQKIRTSNIHSSEFGSVSYDIFGSPYQKTGSFLADDSLDFGYLGKSYNADTELYDYGFRDYSPKIARFSTVDPIRDGRNWYSYVVNDPVNYVDLWGLCKSDGKKLTDEQLATAKFFLGESINGTPINYDDINIYNYAVDAETLRKLAESTDLSEEKKEETINNLQDPTRGTSLPGGNIYLPGNTINDEKRLVHEIYHQVQYDSDPNTLKKVIDEQINYSVTGTDPYKYDISKVNSLSDISTVEGQAQFIEDFVENYNREITENSFSQYTQNMAKILSNSGINSDAVNTVRKSQEEGKTK
ncbi:MAG: RHS repeat-associated core domain-containing protein [Spirochaetaceae bacterium]|nr:RHS repeat-associated core domain-containing protein [Spirochaetaceae bacterium]